ncbi:hypothetical protein TH9_11845 [Thalassospira xiamenensis]|nr:hypothetical protein TH9_11845 [Thalassospira xiamenensis]
MKETAPTTADTTAIKPTKANDIKSLLWTPNLVPILSYLLVLFSPGGFFVRPGFLDQATGILLFSPPGS